MKFINKTSVAGAALMMGLFATTVAQAQQKPILSIELAPRAASVASVPKMTLCSGPDGLNYQWVANQLAKQAKGDVEIDVVDTKGSVDNLDRIVAGTCHAAIVQSDTFLSYKNTNVKSELVLERAGKLYSEYAQLLCNRNLSPAVSSIRDLTKDHVVAIGQNGSGSQTTWAGLIMASGGEKSRYAQVPTVNLDGIRALEKVKDGNEASCMLVTSGLNSKFMQEDANRAGDRIVLAAVTDSSFQTAIDRKTKHPIYTVATIPGGTYSNIQSGVFSSSVETVTIDALLVVDTNWVDNNSKAYNKFLQAKTRTEPDIRKRMGQ